MWDSACLKMKNPKIIDSKLETMRKSPMKRPRKLCGTTSLNKYQKTEFTNMSKNLNPTMKTPMQVMVTAETDMPQDSGRMLWRTRPICSENPSNKRQAVRKGSV